MTGTSPSSARLAQRENFPLLLTPPHVLIVSLESTVTTYLLALFRANHVKAVFINRSRVQYHAQNARPVDLLTVRWEVLLALLAQKEKLVDRAVLHAPSVGKVNINHWKESLNARYAQRIISLHNVGSKVACCVLQVK